jgi:hypothetical protein
MNPVKPSLERASSISYAQRSRAWKVLIEYYPGLLAHPREISGRRLDRVLSTRQHLESVVGKTVALLGKKGIISSELSFRETLSGVLFLSQRMGLILDADTGAGHQSVSAALQTAG